MSLNQRSRGNTSPESGQLPDGIPSDPALRVSGVQARAEPSSPSVPPLSAAITAAPAPLVSIGAPADPSLLEPTYAYLSAYCSACLSPQIAQRINVAVYELYSNALRYGSSAGEVRLELTRTERGVRLSVENHAEPAQLQRLAGQVERVQTNAEAAFSGEMQRFSSGSQPPPMIGLVRVAHESALRVELAVHGQRVRVSTLCEG